MSVVPAGWPVAEAVFLLIAGVTVLSGLAVITRRSPVAAIAWLVIHFVATACAYILLASQFLAAVQVLVYAGAIMVLFLFVIMLLGIDSEATPGAASGLGRKVLAIALGLVLVTLVGKIAATSGHPGEIVAAGAPAAVDAAVEDSVEWLAAALFERHVVSFELASMVLIAAMAGALVFTTRRGPAGQPPAGAPTSQAPGGTP